MKVSELPTEIQEALCAWQAFRRLGYTSEQIFAIHANAPTGDSAVFIKVIWRDMDFIYSIAKTALTRTEFTAMWEQAAAAVQTENEKDLGKMWKNSEVLKRSVELLAALEHKGIFWPKHPDFINLN